MKAADWKSQMAAQGCVLCRAWEIQQKGRTMLHHVREGQGMSQRASDFLVVPLCQAHHQGPSGWHGLGKGGFYQRHRLDELDLLALALEGL